MNQKMWKKGWMLFLFFFKIGCFTFGGGWAILAQMEQEFVERRQWITKSELLDLTAVGKSVPGIMITNIAVIFGYQIAGWFGGICAIIGITTPAVIILSLVTLVYDAIKANPWCFSVLRGISCAVVPIIGSSAISLGKEVFHEKTAILICAVAFLFCYFTKISNIFLILAGILIALIGMGVKKI